MVLHYHQLTVIYLFLLHTKGLLLLLYKCELITSELFLLNWEKLLTSCNFLSTVYAFIFLGSELLKYFFLITLQNWEIMLLDFLNDVQH